LTGRFSRMVSRLTARQGRGPAAATRPAFGQPQSDPCRAPFSGQRDRDAPCTSCVETVLDRLGARMDRLTTHLEQFPLDVAERRHRASVTEEKCRARSWPCSSPGFPGKQLHRLGETTARPSAIGNSNANIEPSHTIPAGSKEIRMVGLRPIQEARSRGQSSIFLPGAPSHRRFEFTDFRWKSSASLLPDGHRASSSKQDCIPRLLA